ncbi:MAG TPA: CheR family methyltransferase [Chthonomonadaceae bacterium]|nr:CheR family methyltransferase [Chthonomonadaceae bacterium]
MNKVSTTNEFESLLEYLKLTRGFDFTAYKRTSLMRRIQKRMQMVGIADYDQYLSFLEANADEFTHLFNTILINVTAFFRDPLCWEYLVSNIIPHIISKDGGEPIRVWSAGCATGEEAYTLAMVLAEALGREAFRDQVKIYATDASEAALSKARQATYSAREVQGVPPELQEKYFEISAGNYVFDRDLRRAIIFGRQDLVQDAPISRIDLLACRNCLMYFNAEAQSRILSRFHYALKENGFLFLGKAETLLSSSATFRPVDTKERVFVKASKDKMRERLAALRQEIPDNAPGPVANHAHLREAALDTIPAALMIVDLDGTLVLANDRARLMSGIGANNVGRPFQDLEISYRPVELRSYIDQAYARRHPVLLRGVEWTARAGNPIYMDVQITPLSDTGGNLIGAAISFTDVSESRRLREELQRFNQELETAYEELQSTNEELQTTNEELQSTVEELETTNEELQSTNEELETMNEELQSTNEELETINNELTQRSEALKRANTFLESILASLRDGVAVIDRDLYILAWNEKALDLWGLKAEEVSGHHFMNLDIGLPVEKLRQSIRSCLAGEGQFTETTLEATNRRGKRILCKVTCAPMIGPDKQVHGAILSMEDLGPPE